MNLGRSLLDFHNVVTWKNYVAINWVKRVDNGVKVKQPLARLDTISRPSNAEIITIGHH